MKTHNPVKSDIVRRLTARNRFEIEREEHVEVSFPLSADAKTAEAKDHGMGRGEFGDTGDIEDNFPSLRRLLDARLVHDTHEGGVGA